MTSSELPASPPSGPPVQVAASPAAAVAAPVVHTTTRRSSASSLLLTLVAAGALALAAATYFQLSVLRKESARRLSDLEQANVRIGETATRADAEARAARERAALLEARVAEEQGQREAMEQLYADLSRGRDEAVTVEVERLVSMAAQELAISGNVATALAALQTADARLARADSPRFLPLRKVLARDIERLKLAPSVDITGIALKMDQIAAGIDGWTLLSDAKLPVPAASTPASADSPQPSTGTPAWRRWLERLRNELGEYRDLVRLRVVDTPDALLLQPQQQQLVRQQIRLRLLNARQALLSRNDRLFRADLGEAQALIARYVDTRQPAPAAALAQLKQIATTALTVEVPQINDSVAAVRANRIAPGR